MKSISLFCILASTVAAAPTQRDGGGPFNVQLTTTAPSGAAAVTNDRLRVGLKYNDLLTQEAKDNLAAQLSARGLTERSGFDVPLTSLGGDVLYNANVKFGTPAQSIDLLIDTGSPTLWVFAPNCTGTCGLQSFNTRKSTTFKDLNQPLNLAYGSGELQGGYVTDFVDLGGLRSTQEFGLGWSAQDFDGLSSTSSGIIGLSWPAGDSVTSPIWLDQIKNNKWADKQFGVYLNRAPPGVQKASGGVLTLAGVDTALFQGSINYINLGNGGAQFGFAWIVPVQSLGVKTQSISLSGSQAIIDTGTSLVYGPQTQVAKLYKSIPGAQALSGANQGLWSVPCNSKNLGVSFTFNGVNYPINDADLVLPTDTPGTCFGGIGYLPGLGLGSNWLVGDVFLKNVYSVYRYQPKSVGFAKLK